MKDKRKEKEEKKEKEEERKEKKRREEREKEEICHFHPNQVGTLLLLYIYCFFP